MRWLIKGSKYYVDDNCPYTANKYVSISFHSEWDMIVVTVFLLILNQMEFHLVQKIERKLSPRSYPIQ